MFSLDAFEIAPKPLGVGASAEVFKAVLRQELYGLSIGCVVALKRLKSHFGADPDETRSRLARHIQFKEKLSHDGIVRILDVDSSTDDRYLGTIVLEYVDGNTLENAIKKDTVKNRIDIATRLASGVKYLHDNKILHRDLKTANVLMSGEIPKIADFGVSRDDIDITVTTPEDFLGTLRYASPQAIAGTKATSQDDIYSLGAIFLELATGKPIFPNVRNKATLIDAIRGLDPGDVDSVVASKNGFRKSEAILIQRMLAKDPGNRPSIDEILEWLKARESNGYLAYLENHHRNIGSSEKFRGLQADSRFVFVLTCQNCFSSYCMSKAELYQNGYPVMTLVDQLRNGLQPFVSIRCSKKVLRSPQRNMIVVEPERDEVLASSREPDLLSILHPVPRLRGAWTVENNDDQQFGPCQAFLQLIGISRD